MPPIRIALTLLAAAGLTALAGCCTTCRQNSYVATRPHGCNHCGDGPLPARMHPVPAPAGRPPAAAPGTPFMPPPPLQAPPAATAPPTAPPTADPGVRLGPPGPARRDAARPPAPETKEPPVASVPGPAPKVEEERDTPLAIDLPGFAIARPNVASGLRPFPDGLTWLKGRGYKTVLHLRGAREDNAAAKRQIEGKGLTYLSLEVAPARMTKELFDEFNRIVTDPANHPLFVYDRDGSAAGGLWYLHFRIHLNANDEKAKAEAARLGLRDDDVEHTTMWVAVEKLAADLRR